MAHHNFSAVFRCRRDLFRLCNGADDCDSAARSVRPGRLHHHAPPGEYGKGDARDRADCRVRLLLRIFHVALQWQQVRRFSGAAAIAWTLLVVLLRADSVQHTDTTIALDPKSPDEC